ncbi:RNA 2',3'-cyclic phosphodiesterase [Gracilibacillus massiliensis]|uniref:RNA 2',3'-cyclic phosphodiesterase n=1 Tax=Gracilibacillus massiliensis TaxID=1564956 RepID=UPI00071DA3DA|nr:RNA 2',3'-cyclic phosphodiesterase [Gracilibacillus massiliensis]
MKKANKHYFIALKIDEKTKKWIYDIQKSCKDTFDFKTWVEPNDFDITLHFFGAISKQQLIKIANDLEQITIKKSFTLEIDQLSTFGPTIKPRVLWLGVSTTPTLKSLHNQIQTIVGHYGNIDKRTFTPHITLAKKWASKNTIDKGNINFTTKTREIKITELVIYEIHPDLKQKYQVWCEFKLE